METRFQNQHLEVLCEERNAAENWQKVKGWVRKPPLQYSYVSTQLVKDPVLCVCVSVCACAGELLQPEQMQGRNAHFPGKPEMQVKNRTKKEVREGNRERETKTIMLEILGSFWEICLKINSERLENLDTQNRCQCFWQSSWGDSMWVWWWCMEGLCPQGHDTE